MILKRTPSGELTSMSDETQSKFNFEFGGISIEVSGEKEFVQEVYQTVMRDVETARKNVEASGGKARGATGEKKEPEAVWVHRSSDMMRKVYMAALKDVLKTPLGELLDIKVVSALYVEKGVFDRLFPDLENSQTLWAEFTQAGRKRIAEATEPARKAAQRSGPQP
jgi:hypothetical protein